MTFYELIQACNRVVSQSEIKRLLHQHKDNEAIKELFRLMLCPSIVYNIKKVPWNLDILSTRSTNDSELVWAIHNLIDAELRGKALSDRVTSIHNGASKDLSAVFNWILDRKNPAKIGKNTVNSVWPDLIRTQKYMGAIPGSEDALERLFREAPYVNVQDKIDGQTGLVDYVEGNAVSIHTRQGNRIDQFFPSFLNSMPFVPYFTGIVHHEILVGSLSRAKGNGLINKQIKNGTIGGQVDEMLRSVLLDLCDYNNHYMHQYFRYEMLDYFTTKETYRVNQYQMTLLEAREYAKKLIQAGGEGVVCKHPEMPFRNGKHWNNVKIKNEFCVDLEVIDRKMHTKDESLLGALLMATSDRGLLVWVNLKCDQDRQLSGYNIMGDVLKVKAEAVTSSKSKKTKSLSLPRFDGDCYLEYKHDKLLADTLPEVYAQEKASKQL